MGISERGQCTLKIRQWIKICFFPWLETNSDPSNFNIEVSNFIVRKMSVVECKILTQNRIPYSGRNV